MSEPLDRSRAPSARRGRGHLDVDPLERRGRGCRHVMVNPLAPVPTTAAGLPSNARRQAHLDHRSIVQPWVPSDDPRSGGRPRTWSNPRGK